jgi:hypothetical protein
MRRNVPLSEKLIPIILVVVAIGVFLSSSRLPDVATADRLGPKLFLYGLALLLAGLSVLLLMGASTAHKADADITLKGMIHRFVPLMLFSVFYVIALRWLGFLISTTLMLVACFTLLGDRKYWMNLLIAVGCAGAIYLLFATALGIQLTALPG